MDTLVSTVAASLSMTLESVMPRARAYHCAVVVDDSTLFVAGGQGAEDSAAYYDKATSAWTMTASMVYPRLNHACGLGMRAGAVRAEVVVAGGWGGGG